MPSPIGASRPSRPAQMDPAMLAQIEGGTDPQIVNEISHTSAAVLLNRVHKTQSPEIVERVLNLVENEGIEVIADLWSQAQPDSLLECFLGYICLGSLCVSSEKHMRSIGILENLLQLALPQLLELTKLLQEKILRDSRILFFLVLLRAILLLLYIELLRLLRLFRAECVLTRKN